ncbi:MAG: glutathione S-transferase N-terminal domain-containing protein [Lentisphaeraceae bacterium]|nr:glutathione S-transferase N-terminal domain-containing protein [Lentisphaeraceae bacterium]
MPELVLYQSDWCPFCRKVTSYLKSKNIEISIVDPSDDPQAAKELMDMTGRRQVPCLSIDGTPLLESDDIVQWFEDNWK